MTVTILIPFYNDAPALPETARRLVAAVGELPYSAEILFCDDGSTDGGGEVVERLALPSVRVLPGEHTGKGGALRRGVLAAAGDVIFYTDADLAYGTDVIARFVEEAARRGGVVAGTRALPGGGYGVYSAPRKAFSVLYRHALRRIGELPVSDPQSGCKAYERGAALAIFTPLKETGFSFELETLLRARAAGYPLTELPVRVLEKGHSHVHPVRDGWRMLRAACRIAREYRR